jgi:hypothetical protein
VLVLPLDLDELDLAERRKVFFDDAAEVVFLVGGREAKREMRDDRCVSSLSDARQGRLRCTHLAMKRQKS